MHGEVLDDEDEIRPCQVRQLSSQCVNGCSARSSTVATGRFRNCSAAAVDTDTATRARISDNPTIGRRGRIIAYLVTISTRRFLARPSSVVLDETGDKLATPMGVSRLRAIWKSVVSACTTAFARRFERSML